MDLKPIWPRRVWAMAKDMKVKAMQTIARKDAYDAVIDDGTVAENVAKYLREHMRYDKDQADRVARKIVVKTVEGLRENK